MLKIPETSPFYAEGLLFSCVRCSNCCRFENGYVFLSEKDASMLAVLMNLGYKDFLGTYCRWIPSGNGTNQLSLKEKSNNDCIFWSSVPEEGCMVYESRPLQCRAFPFWPSVLDNKYNWEITAKDCPGMNRGAFNSHDSIKKWLAARENEPIISRNSMSKGEY